MLARTKRMVIEDLKVNALIEYQKIFGYVSEIKRTNPGSTAELKLTRDEETSELHFQRIYVCFDAVKKGWLSGCRPVLGVDGCFLKTIYKGQLLSAVGRDGNDRLYPLAWAVVEFESTDSWQWFFEMLAKDIGSDCFEGVGLTLISDMQKGLIRVVKNIFPQAEHRFCARHWYANWAQKFKGGELKFRFWKCAKSTYVEQLNENMTKLEALMEGAARRAVSVPEKM